MLERPAGLAVTAAQHNRARTIGEDDRGNQVVDRAIVGLECQRRDLNREEQHVSLRVRAQVIEPPRQACHPAATSELGDRQPGRVRPQPDQRDQLRIERREDNTRTGHPDHEADSLGGQATSVQRRAADLPGEHARVLEIGVRLLALGPPLHQ